MEGEYCNKHVPHSADPLQNPNLIVPNLDPPVSDEKDSLDDFFNFGN